MTALLVVGSAAVADAQCVGGTLTTSGGRDYIYCPTTLNWNAARSDCQAIGTGWDLASVTSNSENTTVRTVGGVNSDRWFGLNDKTTEGTYQWSDGTAFSYTNWATGEPNNSGDEDCVEQYGTTAGATRGRWNDLGCTSATLPFVCEAASGCGNKRISSGETCDDGNTTNGDGCSSSCAVESGWYCDSSQPSVCVAGCSGGVSSSSGGSDYLYCATTVNRATALANCSALGSTWDMVWISNSTENTYVRSLSSVAQWIGLNDITTEGTYVWDGTHTFSYSNWAASQPNNSGGGGGSDCVAQLTAGTWDDITCTSTRAFVCRSSSSGCGNGAVTGSEACDDGDTTNGDGCSSTCTVEPGYSCTGSPSICTPRCVGGKFRFRTIAGSPYTYREYFYCGVSTAWSAAETVCASLGTGWHLTNIGSSGENDYVRNLGSSTQYIGYNDVATEGTFVWSNGGAGTYTNWNSGEPNNSGGEDCTEQQTTGGWNDIACTTAYPYVCEQSDAGAICGNGVIGGSEQCDDGNKASGDGCSSTCVVEDYSCTIPVDNGAASICTVPDHVLLDGVRLLNVAGTPVLEWKTSAQAGTVGFFAARLDEGRNQWVPLHDGMLLAAVNGDAGVTYRLVDRSGSITGAHKYWLQEYDAGGHRITLSNATLSAVRDGAVTRLPAGGFETTVATRRGEPSAVGPVGGTLALRGARVPVGAVVSVPSAGVQAVTVASLASVLGRSAADVTSAIGTGHLSITDDGNDVPWTYDADASRVVFVGEASTSVYTNARPYQVSLAAGHVMAVDDATGTGAAAVGLGRVVTEVEHDTFAGLVASPDPASDYWFDAVLSAGSAKNGSYAASVGLAQVPAQDVAVEVRVFGAWNVDAQNPQHLTLLVNGEAAGAFDVSAVGAVTRTFDVPAAKFVAGKNTLSLTATSDGAPGMGGSYVDGFTLDYITELDLGADHARFEAVADGPMAAIIDGTDVRVFDVTEGREIRAAQDSVAGATEVRFVAHADHLYELVAEGGIATAATLRPSFDGGFASPDLAADLVIVAPHAMRAAADKLATARRGDGLEVEVFDLEDVVDHFAHGLPSPAAITELLRDAQGSWATAPKYVVLVGDGTFDYRHVMGVGPGAMPPALVSTSFGLYASDSSLADLDGDGVADLAVGRLPAHTAEEAMGMVNRIVAYGNLSLSDFTHDVTLAAGENRGTDFERDLDNQAAQLPIRARLNVVRSNGQSLVDARAKILAAMNEGTFWFDYVGHGGLDRLDDRGLLTAADVNALTNVDVAPVVTGMTCSISRFEVPGMPSLGDSLLLGDKGGAIAVWAPTGVSESADAGKVGLRFGKLLMQDAVKQGTVRLGDVVLRTQREAVRDGLAPKDMMSVFALLGDPSMTLPDLSGLAAEGPQTPEVVPPAPDAGTPETDGGPGPGATHDGGCAVGQGAGNSALFAVLLVAALLVIRRRRP